MSQENVEFVKGLYEGVEAMMDSTSTARFSKRWSTPFGPRGSPTSRGGL
jgi:hypothetical protein